MADTPTGETVAAPSNGQAAPVTPTTPPDNNVGSDVDKVRAELQQQMRANQLANEELKKLREEKEARDKAEADTQAKLLEEQNQFKELYEQEKAKREAIESEKEEREKQATLKAAKEELLKDYSDEVRKLAEEVGLDLTSDDEGSQKTFKEKLDKINQSVVSSSKVTPNNPRQPSSGPELSGEQLREVLIDDRDGKKFEEIVADPKKYPGIASMLSQRR